jgi:photosystem II stability/assembly factor-like uncharacterized protein
MHTKHRLALSAVFCLLLITVLLVAPAGSSLPLRVAQPVAPSTSNGWVWQAGGIFNDISMANEHSGWVVGAHGLILHTSDGGAGLEYQESGTSENLLSVHALSSDRAHAVGASGTILFTTDGGATWQPQTSGTAESLNDVVFTDATHGWAVGNNGTILSTSNGGTNWSPQASTTSLDLNGLSFVSSTVGWVAGGTYDEGSHDYDWFIAATANGGQTWTPQYQARVDELGPLMAVQFVDASNGWAVGGDTVLRTWNGGTGWDSSQVTSAHDFAATDLHFTSGKDGWVTGVHHFWGGRVIYSTSNAGVTWPDQVPTSLGRWTAVTFHGEDDGWAVGTGGTLLRTQDSGANWDYEHDTSGMLQDVDSVDRTHAWAAGLDWDLESGPMNKLVGTQDGEDWDVLHPPANDPSEMKAIEFTDTRHGWAAVTNHSPLPPYRSADVLGTDDGGETWDVPVTVSWTGDGWHRALRDIDMVNGQGWAVGEASTNADPGVPYAIVIHSADGGSTWQEQAQPPAEVLNGVRFVSTTHGWAVGESSSEAGLIFHTSNSGTHWTLQYTCAAGALNDVDFVDQDSGWAVGDNGTILHTSNGGSSWGPQVSGSSEDLDAVAFVDAMHGWAAGEVFLVTSDGGTTWQPEQLVRGASDLHGLHFLDLTRGWAVGDDGIIMRYGPDVPSTPRVASAPYASSPPVLDGNLADWSGVPETVLMAGSARWWDFEDGHAPSWQDASATLKAMWDGSTLYFGVHVNDDLLVRDSGNQVWRDDEIEIWVDGDGDGDDVYSEYDHQYTFNTDGTVTDKTHATDVQATVLPVSGGWNVEAAVSASHFPTATLTGGNSIRFTFGYRDDDGGGTWEHRFVWEGDAQNNNTAHHYGTLQLLSGPDTPTPTSTATATSTPSPTPTATSPSPPTSTSTPTSTPTPTDTPSPTPTSSPTPTTTPAAEPDLSASTKAASADTVGYFEEVSYTITLRNTGDTDAHASLSDVPPLPYKTGSALGGIWWDDVQGAIRWEGTVEMGGSRLFMFTVYGPLPTTPPGTMITNEVTIDDGVHPPLVRSASVIISGQPTGTPTATPTATTSASPTPTATITPTPIPLYLPLLFR